MSTVRWNLTVSPEIDYSVRMFIAARGQARKGDLSRFIEHAVRSYLLDHTADSIKDGLSNLPESDVDALIDEALEWARKG